MKAISIVKPGLQTTVQDGGRWGSQANGVSVSGAMDLAAYRSANALVGNDASAAALEVTLAGPEIEFEDTRVVAVAGAPFDVRVNGAAVGMDVAVSVPAGARLAFGARTSGARAYLAISGGIDVPVVLGSRSTHLPSGMGGFEGRALKAGDRLPLGKAHRLVTWYRSVAGRTRDWPDERILRVLRAPEGGRFAPEAFEALLSGAYRVGIDSNRMGFRLEGRFIRHRGSADILSEATPIGSLQVPPSGQPVLLMADRPATGGYPKIATVITADMTHAAQLAPGDSVTFAACSMDEAMDVLRVQEQQLAWTAALA